MEFSENDSFIWATGSVGQRARFTARIGQQGTNVLPKYSINQRRFLAEMPSVVLSIECQKFVSICIDHVSIGDIILRLFGNYNVLCASNSLWKQSLMRCAYEIFRLTK